MGERGGARCAGGLDRMETEMANTDLVETDVVLVPGLLCSPALFAHQVAMLGSQLRVTIADTRSDATFPAMAARILRHAPPRFALAGLSMGGYIAYEILRQAPERVSRLALLDTNGRADRPENTKVRNTLLGLSRAMGVRAVQGLLLRQLVHPERLGDRKLVSRVLDMADWVGPAAFERQTRAIMGRPDNRTFLGQITCPTLIVVGAEDALTPVKVHEEIQSLIRGSRLEIIPECGHLTTMEQPEAVNKRLADWLGLTAIPVGH